MHTGNLASCICCNQSAVTMRLGAGLTSAKLTLFHRSSPTGWTTDSEYLFGAEFSLHGNKITPDPLREWSILNSFGNYWISDSPLWCSCVPRGGPARPSVGIVSRSA
jgi:hypothetical protein